MKDHLNAYDLTPAFVFLLLFLYVGDCAKLTLFEGNLCR